MSEILGALFKYLVALLSVGAVVMVLYQVFGASKTQNAISDLTLLQTEVQSLYNGQNTFTTITNAIAISGKLAPKGMISGAALLNPWGGAVTINVNAGNSARFDVTEVAVPPDGCPKMVTSMSSVVGVSINGTAATLPLDAGTAVTACNAAANALVFTFAH